VPSFTKQHLPYALHCVQILFLLKLIKPLGVGRQQVRVLLIERCLLLVLSFLLLQPGQLELLFWDAKLYLWHLLTVLLEHGLHNHCTFNIFLHLRGRGWCFPLTFPLGLWRLGTLWVCFFFRKTTSHSPCVL